MTVVSALILGKEVDKEGSGELWISDERIIGGPVPYRVSDIAEKLFRLDECYCVGGSGSVPVIHRTLEEVKKEMKRLELQSALEMEQLIKRCYVKTFDRMRDEKVMFPRHITWEEFKSGKIVDKDLKNALIEDLEKFNRFYSCRFIVGGRLKDDKEFRLTSLSFTEETGDIYYSIGVGADRADAVIRDYLQRMRREERKRIPLTLGMRILLEATQAAWGNMGVGGSGQIVRLDDEGYHEFGTHEVKLLHSLIYSEKIGILEKEETNRYIESIVTGAKAEEVWKELYEKIDPERVSRAYWLESIKT
jgi:20S proteasome alpha/beta subunit